MEQNTTYDGLKNNLKQFVGTEYSEQNVKHMVQIVGEFMTPEYKNKQKYYEQQMMDIEND